MDNILKHFATLGFIGYIPFAPGTFGSLCAFAAYVTLRPSVSVHLAILLFMIPLGIISSSCAERLLKANDSRHIVIDEFCGYLLSVFLIPSGFGYALAALFLFRVFDILKPFPIRKIESIFSGGKGVMADDMAAALYTNIILQIWRAVYQE